MDSRTSELATRTPLRETASNGLKIVVVGGFGVGKTTMVRSVSEIRPLNTEETMTQAGVGVETIIAEARQARRSGRSHCARATQDAGDPERELARLEGLAEVIVGARLESGDAGFGLGARGEHEDRGVAEGRRAPTESRRKIDAALAGHHHVEHDEIEKEIAQARARLRGVRGRRDAVAFADEEAGQEASDPPVVVDDKDMGQRGVIHVVSDRLKKG